MFDEFPATAGIIWYVFRGTFSPLYFSVSSYEAMLIEHTISNDLFPRENATFLIYMNLYHMLQMIGVHCSVMCSLTPGKSFTILACQAISFPNGLCFLFYQFQLNFILLYYQY